ncbi:NAD(P)H-binding protein [Mucilaginibacter sp. RS28]|uniref:NAD(P)H-binding protein n=1 Tax=Mucilaginibacter straminoryzae TaxID=2932774 RepID=A0A9X2BAK1_9SPHI|nr:NAD(P)H-binding protein [Mucilaginibacter straminoryzae]MCJ8211934.1 NAD(P)H-binding protein [Mucilaginibacter straminoryzae]
MKYVLSGSLGNINKPLTEKLIAAGHDVTVISSSEDRKPQIEALGAKAAIGSVTDESFLAETFKGADAVFTLIPPILIDKDWKGYIHSVGKKFANAIKEAGVKKVVNLSSIGAHMPEGCGPVSGLHFAEQELNALAGVDVKHLRPGYFYTNLYAMIGLIKHAGIIGNNFTADVAITMVHPNDIAEAAAEELLNLNFTGNSVRYVVSDERTSKEVAAVLGAAISKPELPYVEFTDEQNLDGMLQADLPEEVAKNYVEMGTAIRSGEMAADYRQHPVTLSKTKLEDFAKEFAAAYNA